jgi:hypothetical protein
MGDFAPCGGGLIPPSECARDGQSGIDRPDRGQGWDSPLKGHTDRIIRIVRAGIWLGAPLAMDR